MKTRSILILSALGVVAGLSCASIFAKESKPQPPAFAPVSSPYENAIYANGIVESDQANGSNMNLYPEVPGPITKVMVREGQHVQAGTVLAAIDDAVQRATVEQLRAQAEAAQALLDELKAQPRPETLAIAKAQVAAAASTLTLASHQFEKRRASYQENSSTISKDALDTAEDTVEQAKAGLEVATRQCQLAAAGAWSFDVASQERQCESLRRSALAAEAQLRKYAIVAPTDAVVLAVNASVGSYVSPQGVYDAYTQGSLPMLVLGAPDEHLAVRCYVDEILVSRLPEPGSIRAEASIRGTTLKVPLEFVRVQPLVSPKIQLSNQRQEKVDLRVLPVLFRFAKQAVPVYPGQLVDVYIGRR